jgi:aminopeptidase N
MIAKIAAFELRYQLRQPLFWSVSLIFFLLTFGSVTIDQIQIGSGGNIHKNAPVAIAQTHLVWSIFYMFVTTAFVANIIVRDDETGFGQIIRSTRLTRSAYLIGRFMGAFAAVALSFLFVPLAIYLGSLMPWIDPETLGPNRLVDYAFAYGVLALPALLLTSSAFFALATVTRSMMATYLGVVAFFIAYLVLTTVLDKPQWEQLVAVFEPFGMAAYSLATRYYTATEANNLVPPLSGALFWSRLLSLGLSAAFLGLAYGLFRFEPRPETVKATRPRTNKAYSPAKSLAVPTRFGPGANMAVLASRTRLEMAQVFKSPAFIILLTMGVVNAGGGLWFSNEAYGGTLYPVTRVMVTTLYGAFGIIPILIAIYYAGELVWRERDRRVHEIIDAAPIPDWAFYVPKTLAVSLVLLATLIVGVMTAVLVQALRGYNGFELGKYLVWFVLPQAIDSVLLAILAVFFQTLSPQKFIGWGLMVLYLISTLTLNNLGFEHNLYQYAGTPHVPLSDMNGQGRFWIGAAWFKLYWTAFALVLAVLSYGLWRRGTETRLWPRLVRFPARLKGPAGILMAAAALIFAGAGGFIYLNTNVWNEYRTRIDDEKWLADYEKALLTYETVPQPRIYKVQLTVDLYPHEPRVVTHGVYAFENKTDQPLREIHLNFDRDLMVEALSIEGARPTKTYDRFNYRIFTFDTPLQPGEKRRLTFTTTRLQRGFKNRGDTVRVVDNGTFINDREIAPSFGIGRDGLLQDRAKRRKYGLPPERRMAKLGDSASRAYTYLRHDSDWVQADLTVSTVADQIPIAPGYKVSDIVANGRRTAHFRTEAPIQNFFSIQSARYAVRTEPYKGIDLAIYYDPQHAWNIERMLKAMKASLDYYQANFSPYQFRQARILEFPDYAQFAQSFANTIPYSEGIGFIANYKDPEKIDLVTYVTAHELAHQWWAHQVIGADQQGSTVLSETLAQYSALMVMEKMYGPEKIRKFLSYELRGYLRNRGGEAVEELPLAQVENQDYIHYRKGSLVMYRLKDEIGAEAVNRALRALLAKYAFKAAPYPTALDLIAALRAEAPADKQDLITDLFEKITLYDIKTTKAVARKRSDGRFDLTLTVDAQKLYADGQGKETKAPLNEVIDIGVFKLKPDNKAFDRSQVIGFERRQLRAGVQTITIITDSDPKFAGIDPYAKLIDRNTDDNVRAVERVAH